MLDNLKNFDIKINTFLNSVFLVFLVFFIITITLIINSYHSSVVHVVFEKEIRVYRNNAINIIERTIDTYSIATNQSATNSHIKKMIDNPDIESVEAIPHLLSFKTNFQIEDIYLLTSQGEMLYENASNSSVVDTADFRELIRLAQEGTRAVAGFIDSGNINVPILYIAQAVRGKENSGVVVVGKIFDDKQMLKMFPKTEEETRGIILFSDKGLATSSNRDAQLFNKVLSQDINQESFRKIESGNEYENIFNNDDFQGIIMISAINSNTRMMRPFGFYIEAGNMIQLEKDFISFSFFSLFVVFLLIVFSIFMARKNITKPILNIKKGFEKFEDDDYSFSLQPSGFSEIKEIGKGYNLAASEINANFKDLKVRKNRIAESLKKEKHLEYNLILEHNHIEEIINSISDSILVLNISLNITSSNTSAEKILGKSKSNLVGKYLGDAVNIYKDGKEFEYKNCFILDAISLDTQMTTKIGDNYTLLDKSGNKIPIIVAVSSLKGSGKDRGVVLVIRDITNEKRLDDSKTNFISTASHQLRTPLTSLRWLSEMLISGDAGKVNKDQKVFLNNIYEGVLRMVNLVNLLLQLARVEAGRVRIEPVAVNLPSIMKDIIASFQLDIENKQQKVLIDSNLDEVQDIYMDFEVVWQVFQNLISNAIRYSPEKSVVNVKFEQENEFIKLSIEDSGIGIPEKQQDKIFEKFYRANNAMKLVPEGSGLGLSLVKLLVVGWGGKVWFESKKNNGTTFFVTIPLGGMEARDGEIKLSV